MLILPGTKSLSESKQNALIKSLSDNSLKSVASFYLHFVQLAKNVSKLSDETNATLELLLKTGSIHENSKSPLEESLLNSLISGSPLPQGWYPILVTPRPGTISPWSSKATDIARICGLNDYIFRIERGQVFFVQYESTPSENSLKLIRDAVHDRMTEAVHVSVPNESILFSSGTPGPLKTISLDGSSGNLVEHANMVLKKYNTEWGLALSEDEINYLATSFTADSKSIHHPTDAEIMMFSQINSEHCRHKIFNASWNLDGKETDVSLFSMIKETLKAHGGRGVLSAYHDNAAVLAGAEGSRFHVNLESKEYQFNKEPIHTLIKVETHNHPTAVSPFSGASTGSGGEIRDEAAVGIGSKTKAGLTGFTVSNLCIPGFLQPWETESPGKPARIASALDIMIDGPLGGAAFNNEFGRPNLTGFFRTYLEKQYTEQGPEWRGYHKPIMIAGGLGTVRPMHICKRQISDGAPLIVLGGPSMLIGLGGGAASSMASGASSAELDFASVQRENPEMERRAQMVIDACTSLGNKNPIVSIHDVGAGGLSNALPELIHDSEMGAKINLRDIPCDDPSMSPMQIWCNESQERYVLSVDKEDLKLFSDIAARERCPFAVVGYATTELKITMYDSLYDTYPINLDMTTLFGRAPRLHLQDSTRSIIHKPLTLGNMDLSEMTKRVLSLPSVASKAFLITIGDRYVTGLVARDQMVGPWQTPVADIAVVLSSTEATEFHGQAMAMGERPPIALISPSASARMAIGEALTNLAAADIADFNGIALSANWMASPKSPGEGVALYSGVQAAAHDLAVKLGLVIPVGKDSLSMKTVWENDKKESVAVTSPLSLVVTAYSNVFDARKTWTPQLQIKSIGDGSSVLLLIDLGAGKKRMGGSAIAQVYNQIGNDCPDVERHLLKPFWTFLRALRNQNLVLAYHDRSDGGLFATVAEMAFAGHVGVTVNLDSYAAEQDFISALFNEELGAVIQVTTESLSTIHQLAKESEFPSEYLFQVGTVTKKQDIEIHYGQNVWNSTRVELQRIWAETSYRIQSIRDDSSCAEAEYAALLNSEDRGLSLELTFDPEHDIVSELSTIPSESRPKVAILREQGVNSYMEMAYAFHRAGFTCVDVHMTDLLNGRISLDSFVGLACPGGFSYGDVLGAGSGWAKSILLHQQTREELKKFFHRKDTFTIGICNGCQMLSTLASLSKDIIPGTEDWPTFQHNTSGRFEARTVQVTIPTSTSSIFFKGMGGSSLPIAVAHGEGRAEFPEGKGPISTQIAMQYVKHDGGVAGPSEYPFNPNGSIMGISGVTSADGRVLALMPHPERVVRGVTSTWQASHDPDRYGLDSGWIRMFRNARQWVAEQHNQ